MMCLVCSDFVVTLEAFGAHVLTVIRNGRGNGAGEIGEQPEQRGGFGFGVLFAATVGAFVCVRACGLDSPC